MRWALAVVAGELVHKPQPDPSVLQRLKVEPRRSGSGNGGCAISADRAAGVQVPALARSTAAVSGSAGKNDSIASSETVTSIGVPKTVIVLKKVSSRSP